MRTTYVDGKPMHPDDVLAAFGRRLAPFTAMGHMESGSDVFPAVSNGLCELGDDFDEAVAGIKRWLKEEAPAWYEGTAKKSSEGGAS
ncbi:MAG TPA: hypothetical protein VML95_08605 [Longimicrobiales bacterium]|nr:hypothetical protein [Longimicrobiales bacterium]